MEQSNKWPVARMAKGGLIVFFVLLVLLLLVPLRAAGQPAVQGTLAYELFTNCQSGTFCPNRQWLEAWDLGNSQARPLTPRPSPGGHRFDADPAWSPDGHLLAFVRTAPHRSGIYVVGANGKGTRRIVPLTRSSADAASFPGIAWSPDGKEIAFDRYGAVECSTTKPFRHRLTVGTIDGKRVVDIPLLPRAITHHQVWKVMGWSPDGTKLLYSITQLEYDETDPGACREHGPEPGHLYAIGSDGQGRHLLASTDAEVEEAAWSPDSKQVAYGDCYYTESHGGVVACDLARIAADGNGKPKTLRTAELRPGGILWSTKGNELIANLDSPMGCQDSITDCTSRQLFAINTSSGQARLLGAAGEILGASRDDQYIATWGPQLLLVPFTGGAALAVGTVPKPGGTHFGADDLYLRS